eukprot:GHUV01029384.1.p1 GENE.GHUV01029384.1~~GHUV01029384.1.p1  ORF type:complete len:309 (+),score=65.91 GHUV01029384.1:812-1738(+)
MLHTSGTRACDLKPVHHTTTVVDNHRPVPYATSIELFIHQKTGSRCSPNVVALSCWWHPITQTAGRQTVTHPSPAYSCRLHSTVALAQHVPLRTPLMDVHALSAVTLSRQSGRESKFAQQRDIPRSPLPEKKNEPRHNQQIRAPEIMVIFPDGSKQILDNASAKAAAASLKLDLVEVSARVNPPVARIMDYGQHRYEQQKKADEAEKQKRLAAKFNTPKEMQFSTRIGDHDLEFKLKKVLEFLEDGYRVQLTVKHKREEEAAAAEALDYLVARIQSSVAVEAAAKQQRRRALTILVKPKGTPEQTAAS